MASAFLFWRFVISVASEEAFPWRAKISPAFVEIFPAFVVTLVESADTSTPSTVPTLPILFPPISRAPLIVPPERFNFAARSLARFWIFDCEILAAEFMSASVIELSVISPLVTEPAATPVLSELGAHFAPSHFKTWPALGGVVVVSTSASWPSE